MLYTSIKQKSYIICLKVSTPSATSFHDHVVLGSRSPVQPSMLFSVDTKSCLKICGLAKAITIGNPDRWLFLILVKLVINLPKRLFEVFIVHLILRPKNMVLFLRIKNSKKSLPNLLQRSAKQNAPSPLLLMNTT